MMERTLRWDRFVERLLPRVPLRRWGVPEDFGAIAVYLASDASVYPTGDTFVIDGGARSSDEVDEVWPLSTRIHTLLESGP